MRNDAKTNLHNGAILVTGNDTGEKSDQNKRSLRPVLCWGCAQKMFIVIIK